jgi:hypothetical protein
METSSEVTTSGELLRCARHPNTETVLRCGRCETPICPRCLVSTPVGARCPDCAQVKRIALFLKPVELARAAVVGVLAATVGTIIALNVPLLGPLLGFMLVGFLTGEAVLRAVNRKRAPELGPIAIACLVVGMWLGVLVLLVFVQRVPPSLELLAVPARVFFGNLLSLLGLGVGALRAWMRVR